MKIVLVETYFEAKDWRTPATYKMIRDAISENWETVSVVTYSADELKDFVDSQAEQGEVFVVNVAEYLNEEDMEGFLPEILDSIGHPFLGSGNAPSLMERHKAHTKEILIDRKIPTPDYLVAGIDKPVNRSQADAIGYPLFAKPEFSGGHFGISENSIVESYEELVERVSYLSLKYRQDVLVEKYLTGPEMREFTVGVIDARPRIYTPREINFDKMDVKVPILTTNLPKAIERVTDPELVAQLNALAGATHDAIDAVDYSRVDIRSDETGLYVLEIQTMPGHSTSVPKGAELLGISYADKLKLIITASMERQKLIPKGSSEAVTAELGLA